ncbi:MAG: HNH endonuclease [Gammaproteobacteria bacterium]
MVYWELFPTVDHIVPVARGGGDDETNWVTTSMLRNSAKSNWLLEELGWLLVPPGDFRQWDGLLGWFIEFLTRNQSHLADKYIRRWHRAAVKKMHAVQPGAPGDARKSGALPRALR